MLASRNGGNHHRESRGLNSPLPAVPLPAKRGILKGKERLTSTFSYSCSDLLENEVQDNNSYVPPPKPSRTVSMDLMMIPTDMQPLIGKKDTGEGKLNATQTIPLHDYEELPAQQNLRDTNYNSRPEIPTISPSPLVKDGYPRERQNPMYSGIRTIPSSPSNMMFGDVQDVSSKRPATIGERCACVLVIGFVLAIVISLLSLTLMSLMLLGIVSPLSEQGVTDLKGELSDLKADLERLQNQVNIHEEETSQTVQNQSNLISHLATKFENKTLINKRFWEFLHSLPPADINDIFGLVTGGLKSTCKYNSFSIGSSSNQDSTESGEYGADLGYVVTGATCSATGNYIGTLISRTISDKDGNEERYYKCICAKLVPSDTSTSTQRVECRIHYWQCPVSKS